MIYVCERCHTEINSENRHGYCPGCMKLHEAEAERSYFASLRAKAEKSIDKAYEQNRRRPEY